MAKTIATLKSTQRPSGATKDVSDEALIRRIATGEDLALQVLFERYNVRIFRFVLRLINDKLIAEDVVNEVFFAVWSHADEFEGRSLVSTWLMAIARHKALEVIRSRSYEALDEDAAEAIEDPSEDPETALETKDTSSIVRKCLTQLSPAHQEIIDLAYFRGKSVAEVSEIVGTSLSTVKTRMFYARKHMAELLGVEGIDCV